MKQAQNEKGNSLVKIIETIIMRHAFLTISKQRKPNSKKHKNKHKLNCKFVFYCFKHSHQENECESTTRTKS